MSITPINVGGQQYSVDVSMENAVKTVSQSAITSAVSGITAEQHEQIEKRLLKDGFTIKLVDGTKVTSEQELEALGRLENIFSTGDPLVDSLALMKLFQQCQQTIRSTARQQRISELTAQISSLNTAADEMKSAADKRLAAGIVQGVMGIVGGSIQVGAGVVQTVQATKAFNASNSSIKSQEQANEAQLDLANQIAGSPEAKATQTTIAEFRQTAAEQGALATKLGSQAQAVNQFGMGTNQITTSTGNVIGSAVTHEAEMNEVKRVRLEAEAKTHEAALQSASEMMQKAQDLIQDMKEKIAATQQAQVETSRGIARNI